MTGWLVVVPVKRSAAAKSRLELPGRAAVARAVTMDTLEVLLAVPSIRRVLVITDESEQRAEPWPVGVRVLRQRRAGLVPAIGEGLGAARLLDPSAPTAVVLGDLPLITPTAVTSVLSAAGRVPSGFVRDAAGTGTTMVTMAPGVRFTTAFGRDSSARHRALGAIEILAAPGLRQDLDTAADLARARRSAGRRLSRLLAVDRRLGVVRTDEGA